MKVFIKGLDIKHGKDTIKLEELNVEVKYKELLECIQELGVLNSDDSEEPDTSYYSAVSTNTRILNRQINEIADINSKMEDLVEAIKTDDFSKII